MPGGSGPPMQCLGGDSPIPAGMLSELWMGETTTKTEQNIPRKWYTNVVIAILYLGVIYGLIFAWKWLPDALFGW